jgi:AraC-like DNA-binding protein
VEADFSTAFTYYELESDFEIRNVSLSLNYIIFVIRGKLTIDCNEFKECKLISNEMLLLLRSSAINIKCLQNTKLFVFYFDSVISPHEQNLLKSYLPDVEKNEFLFSSVQIREPLVYFLEQLKYYQDFNIDTRYFHKLKHEEFFLIVLMLYSKSDILTLFHPLISNSFNFRNKVLENFNKLEYGRVTELADLVGIGRKKFDKDFKNEFGVSPSRWIQQETAKRLKVFLSQPDITISDAMYKFRFNSPSHFNRFCKRYFSKSPGEIIKENNNYIRI